MNNKNTIERIYEGNYQVKFIDSFGNQGIIVIQAENEKECWRSICYFHKKNLLKDFLEDSKVTVDCFDCLNWNLLLRILTSNPEKIKIDQNSILSSKTVMIEKLKTFRKYRNRVIIYK